MKNALRLQLLFVIALTACAATTTDNAATDARTLTFIHLNDTYRIDAVEEGRRGGFGRVTTVVRQLLARGHDVRITHGGDFLYPSLESQLWNGAQMVEALNFLNSLAPLYAVPGNHEFDPRSADSIVDAMRGSEFTWIADNMRLQTGEPDVDGALHTAHVVEAAGHKIGIFGLTLLPRDGGNERDYAPVDQEYLSAAERAITKLESAGAEMILGLTHLHLTDDKSISALKQRHPKLAFIVGGHEHEPEYEAADDDNAAVLKGASNARVIWQVDVSFEGGRVDVSTTEILVDERIAQDVEYQQIADRWRSRLLAKIPFLPSLVGEAALPLDGREVTIRNQESNWGNFIVDQMPAAFGDPVADFAFVNSGTLRIDDYVAEDITFEDIGRTFGFSSFLRYMTISGGDFMELMEAGFRGEGPSKGYFPQISGFRLCIDRSQSEGHRIVQLQIPGNGDWKQIEVSADYTLVAPDFLYRGGDGYDFSKARNVSRPGSELKYLVLDGIVGAQAEGRAIGEPVDPANPRYVELSPERMDCWSAS